MAEQKITGGCHCGKVRIEANLDLSQGSGRCNCSICAMTGFRHLIVPHEADLSSYEWGGKISKRMFCRHCGVHVFGRGYLEEVGGDFCSVNVAALDVDPAVLDKLPIRYFDGLHNKWESTPEHTGYL